MGNTKDPMNGENNFPQACYDTGLTCQACTESTAQKLALVCRGLQGKMIGQMFVQIYSEPACAPMHAHFATAYREALSRQVEPGISVAPPPRRDVASERRAPRVMVAVA